MTRLGRLAIAIAGLAGLVLGLAWLGHAVPSLSPFTNALIIALFIVAVALVGFGVIMGLAHFAEWIWYGRDR